ncbi:MAG: hypothetical protein K5654_06880 [Lachnospiraceae bacterium]|nr:hypothetical protein [Lachnospiraceae bacterium]
MEYRKSGLCIAGLVLGVISFVFNPCYIISLLAFIFGLVGLSKSTDPAYRGMATAAWICAIASFLIQVLFDTLTTIFSMGMGFFTFFI